MGDIRIKIEGGTGDGISQAIQKAIANKYDNQDIWSVADDKFKNHKTDTWTEIFSIFQKESENEVSTFAHKNETKGIKEWWTELNMNVKTKGDDELVIKESTWHSILQYLGLEQKGAAPKTTVTEQVEQTETVPVAPTETVQVAPTETVQVAPTETVQVTPTALEAEDIDSNPPTDDANPPAASVPPKDEKLKQDKKPPQAVPAPILEIPAKIKKEDLDRLKATDVSKAGQTIANENNTKTQYDSQGRIAKEYDSNDNVIFDVKRDSNGNIRQTTEYKFDNKGNSLSAVTRDVDGEAVLESYSTYDKNGNKTQSIEFGFNHNLIEYTDYEYDSKGRVTKRIIRNPDGSVDKYIGYKYDKHGNLLKETQYDSTGKVIRYEEHKYNKNGFIDTTVVMDENGKYVEGTNYEYLGNGFKKHEIKRNSDGTVKEYQEFVYDNEFNCTKLVCRDAKGKVLHYFEYRTDDSGTKICIKRDPSGKELGRETVND